MPELKSEKQKSLISIVVPVYNEEECLAELYRRTAAVMDALADYETELVFFDDGSTDRSREMIEELCRRDERCKAVFFARNYGYNKAIFYAVRQAKGDCAVLLHADLQNPPEVIPQFVTQWEHGADVVFGVKNKSKENKFMYFLRTLAYLVFNFVFGMHLIAHATDFELVDRSVVEQLRAIDQREPILRILLREAAKNPKRLTYTQEKRTAGKSKFSLSKYYELAISWIVASSKVLPRRVLCVGLVLFSGGIIELFAGFLPHIRQWSYESISTAIMLRLGFILFSVMICFGAVMSEYLMASSTRESQFELEEKKRIHY